MPGRRAITVLAASGCLVTGMQARRTMLMRIRTMDILNIRMAGTVDKATRRRFSRPFRSRFQSRFTGRDGRNGETWEGAHSCDYVRSPYSVEKTMRKRYLF